MTAHLSESLSFAHPAAWSPRAVDLLVWPGTATAAVEHPNSLRRTAVHDAVVTQLAHLLERPEMGTATGEAAHHLVSFVQRVVVDGAPQPMVSSTQDGELTVAFESAVGTVEATFLADGYSWVVLVSPTGAVRPLYDGSAGVGLPGELAHHLGLLLGHLSRLPVASKGLVEAGGSQDDVERANPMDYDAARELATEIGGRYVALEQGAHDEGERSRWFQAARDLDDQVRAVDPFDARQVGVLRAALADRLRTLRS